MSSEPTFTEPPVFDLSALGYEECVCFLFDRRIVDDFTERQIYFFGDAVFFEVKRPAQLVAVMTATFGQLGSLVSKFSPGQIGQGLWELFNPASIRAESVLLDPVVPHQIRAACIRSIRRMYGEVVAHWPESEVPQVFDLLWHSLGAHFWFRISSRLDQSLSPDETETLDTMFEALREILLLPDGLCEHFALHGLGHLRHPKCSELIQEYIGRIGQDISSDELRWIEQCRDGTVM